MKTALLVLLVSSVAFADDAPRIERVAPGYVVTKPAWLINDEGKAKLEGVIQSDRQKVAQLEADKAALGAVPALTWRGAVLLVGVGLLVGFAGGFAIHQALQR